MQYACIGSSPFSYVCVDDSAFAKEMSIIYQSYIDSLFYGVETRGYLSLGGTSVIKGFLRVISQGIEA